jgi:transposase
LRDNWINLDLGGIALLGHRPSQTSFADTDEWYKRIPARSVWAQMRAWTAAHLHDADFAHWYAETGRPSIPPSLIVPLLILALRQGWSDQEAVDAAFYDDRVKFALGLSRSPEITLDRSTLCKYRGRLLAVDADRLLLRQTLTVAAEAGLLGAEEDLVDSFMVAGAAARQGTLTLIRRAVAAVLRQGAADGIPAPPLERTDYAERRRPAIPWADPAARQALLQELVTDGRTCGAWYTGARAGSESLQQAVQLLATVTEQDIEPDPNGGVRIAQRVAADRVISTVDPAMRHGRKTTATKVDGYKSHQLTQSTPPAQGARLVTAVLVSPANVADGDRLAALVTERGALTGQVPRQVMGDTAYGPTTVQAAVTAVAPTTTVVAPVPPTNNHGGLFPKTAFLVDCTAETVTCPHGVLVAYTAVRPRQDGRRVVRWAAVTCQACPLRAQCVAGPRPRSLSIRADEAVIQAARQQQATPEWQARYRRRSHVEHVQAQQSRHGGRQGRYWGERKTLWQERLVAVAYNIMELARVAALPRPEPGPGAVACA